MFKAELKNTKQIKDIIGVVNNIGRYVNIRLTKDHIYLQIFNNTLIEIILINLGNELFKYISSDNAYNLLSDLEPIHKILNTINDEEKIIIEYKDNDSFILLKINNERIKMYSEFKINLRLNNTLLYQVPSDTVYKIFVCMPSKKLYDIVCKLYKLEDLIFIEVMKNVIIFKVLNKEYDISYKFESNYAPYKNEQNLIENHYDILFPITADTLELISKSYIIYPSVIICLALHEPIQFIYEIPGDIKSYIKFYVSEDSDLLSESSEN